MKSKYLIIKNDGQLKDPAEYAKSKDCSEEFKVFIEKEALQINAKDKPEKPEFMRYANKLGFNWEPNADIGLMRYDYKAYLIIRLIMEYAREIVNKIGLPIYEVRGSNIFDMSHPVVDAYAKLYGDRLFRFKSGKKEVVMSYDASYPQFNLAGKYQLSNKDLPFAHFSISDCYRHEQSGECMLFYRLRRFFMPDLHPYFRNVEEAFKWYPRIEKQIVKAAEEVGQKYHLISEIGSESDWKKYRSNIIEIARNGKQEMLVEIHCDKKPRYWIINNDYKIIDQLGQSREIACIQIDVGNAKRLGINYLGNDNKSHYPAIIHAAIPGGIERFVYMLFDNFKKSFPLWLHPIQIRLVPLGESHVKYCKEILDKNSNNLVRIDIDDRSESVSKRVKRAKEELIPYVIVIGEKEQQGKGNLSELKAAIQRVVKSSGDKPFLKYSWPWQVSKQVR